jgi:hypothetical protein
MDRRIPISQLGTAYDFAQAEPQSSGLSLADLGKLVPPAARAFGSTLMGNREPITEGFFTPAELEILRRTSENRLGDRSKAVIGYGDYGEKDPWADGSQAVFNALTDPAHSLAFTLGMAKAAREPDGSIVITDKYDFNANRGKVDKVIAEKGRLGALASAFADNGLLGVGNALGNMAMPEGEGRDVRIRIPPRAP